MRGVLYGCQLKVVPSCYGSTFFDSIPRNLFIVPNQAEMLAAIRAVANGEAIFGPSIAQRLIGFFSNIRPVMPSQIFPELTEREVEVLGLIAQGRTNEEIALHLTLSLKTIRNHVSNIFSKLQVADRAQAVLRAREAGLG